MNDVSGTGNIFELINELNKLKKPIAIWGCGHNGKAALAYLENKSIVPDCFIDGAPDWQGQRFANKYPVYAPEKVMGPKTHYIVISTTKYLDEIIWLLQNSGWQHYEDYIGFEHLRAFPKNASKQYNHQAMIPEDYFQSRYMVIDTLDSCNLSCATCPRGSGIMRSSSKTMDLEMYREIIFKGKQDFYTEALLYNWTEPFLNKKLPEYVSIAKKAKMKVGLSSNLAVNDISHLRETLSAGVDQLVISVSGSNPEVHEINHRGGGGVFKNLRILSETLKCESIKTRVILTFLKFSYNHSCETALRELAAESRFDFLVYPGSGDPFRKYKHSSLLPLGYNKDIDFNGGACELMLQNIPIDCEGDVYLCCHRPNTANYRVSNYLSTDHALLRAMRQMHAGCNACAYKRVPMSHKLIENMTALSEKALSRIKDSG